MLPDPVIGPKIDFDEIERDRAEEFYRPYEPTPRLPLVPPTPQPRSLPPAYSDWKAGWHLDKIADLRSTGQTVPSQIQLVISDLCNHDCSFCAYRLSGYSSNQHFADAEGNNNPKRMIPAEKCFEILDDAKAIGVRAVQFTGGGEPTVHPDHLEIFAHALGLGLECSLVTNGNLLREDWEQILPRFRWIRVSLDAGTATTYSSVRRTKPEAFRRALGNLRQLSESVAPEATHLGVSFIVTKENYREIALAAGKAAVHGAHSIRYAAVFTPELGAYYQQALRDEITASLDTLRKMPPQGIKIIDMFSRRVGDLDQGAPDYHFCGYQHFNVYIGADLSVYRCCNTAYNDLGLTGSLSGMRFKDFWESEQKKEAYSSFDATSCAHCAFNGQNKILNYLVDPAPVHVNFV